MNSTSSRNLDLVAAIGLGVGAVFGLAGTLGCSRGRPLRRGGRAGDVVNGTPIGGATGERQGVGLQKSVATVHQENVMMSRQFDPDQFVLVAGDAIIAADTSGSIVLWNPAAERMFGYTESEALGQSLDIIIPERLRHRHWEGYRQVMQTGQTRYGTEVLHVPAVHKDGRTLSIAFTVALLETPDKQSRVIAAILRDETRRWKEERALRQRLAELEAKND
jgi:PAS domain S-box-containing protein